MSSFKVGERVRRIKYNNPRLGCETVRIGDTGIVVAHDGGLVRVHLDRDGSFDEWMPQNTEHLPVMLGHLATATALASDLALAFALWQADADARDWDSEQEDITDYLAHGHRQAAVLNEYLAKVRA